MSKRKGAINNCLTHLNIHCCPLHPALITLIHGICIWNCTVQEFNNFFPAYVALKKTKTTMKGFLGQLSFTKTSPSAPLCTRSGKEYE